MGYIFKKDGECVICGQHTEYFCDSCEKYICEDHIKKRKLKYGKKELTFCPDCYKEGKAANMPYRRVANPSYIDR